MNDENSSRIFLVHGRVQGVGFRHFVWKTAVELGIRGWVRNLSDGSVEVAGWGSTVQLDTLNAALSLGPRWSQVDSVVRGQVLEDKAPVGQFSVRN